MVLRIGFLRLDFSLFISDLLSQLIDLFNASGSFLFEEIPFPLDCFFDLAINGYKSESDRVKVLPVPFAGPRKFPGQVSISQEGNTRVGGAIWGAE